MKNNFFDDLKYNSKDFQTNPPERVWSRLEYKLDRAQFERKRNNKTKMVYAISIVAVFVSLISFISIIKQDSVIISTDTKSEFLVSKSINNNQGSHQAYDVHKLKEYYFRLNLNSNQSKMKEIKVNLNPKS